MTHWQALIHMRDLNVVFTSDDTRRLSGDPDPDHQANGANNVIGADFRKAHKLGLIVPVGYTQSKEPKRKGGMIRQWRGTTEQGRLV